jgi:uncharacterized protein YlzI (FlbEa/FlbD family)
MAYETKHVGKMKNNSARVAVVYRTLPGDSKSALVVGTNGLTDSYHDSLMSLIESDTGQQANELAEVLAVRRFPDGTVMLQFLHGNGHLKKVPTHLVIMTPSTQGSIPLDKLNEMIAEQRGISIDELAVSDGSEKKAINKIEEIVATDVVVSETKKSVVVESTEEISDPVLIAKQYRSKADKLAKDAANFRRMADAIDPPKAKESKAKKTVAA